MTVLLILSAGTVIVSACTASITNPSNTIVDVGQYESFTASQASCVSTFTYNVLAVNSVTPGTITHNDLLTGQTSSSVVYTFQTTSADTSNSPEKANVVVTDSGANTVTSAYSTNFIIYSALGTPAVSPSSPSIDSGQSLILTATWTGGAPDYTAKWYTGPSGNTCAQDSANVLATYSSLTGTSNSISVSPTTTNSYCAGITDSATTNEITTSSNDVITVNTALGIPSISPSNPSIDNGQSITLSSSWSGGTSTYGASLYSSPTSTCNQQSTLVEQEVGLTSRSSIFSPVTPLSNTYYCVFVTDNAVNSYSITTLPQYIYQPQGVAISPSGTYAYVASLGNSNVVIINTATGEGISTINSGFNNPKGIAFSPSGTYAYVTNYGSNNVVIINTATNTITGSITSGISSPQGVAFANSGAYAYVVNSGNVVMINTSTSTVTGMVLNQGYLTGIAVSPSGNYAYISDIFSNNILILNTVSNTITGAVTSNCHANPQGIAFSPSGTYAYLASCGSVAFSVSLVDTATNTIVYSTISDINHPYGVSFSPSGNYVYVTNSNNDNIAVISPEVPTTNSVTEATVNNVVAAGAITPANPAINLGQSTTLAANAIGGTSPYTYNWYTIAGATAPSCTTTNQITGQNANTITVSPISTNSYAYQVTDSSPTNSIACSAGDEVTVKTGFQATNPYKNGPTGFFGHLPGATTATSSTTSTVSTTTSAAVTTMPVITSTGPTSQACSNTEEIRYPSINAEFIISNIIGCINVTASNETAVYLNITENINNSMHHIITAINYTSKSRNISTIAIIGYDCGLSAGSISPFILRNTTWQKILPFTVNATACTIEFAVPSDPVIAILNTNHTVINTATTQTSIFTTTTYNQQGTGGTMWLWVIIIVIILIVIISLFIYFKNKLS